MLHNQRRMLNQAESMAMIRLKVEGMTCGHCEQTVRQALAAVPGVTEVIKVDRNDDEAVVEGDADPAALAAAVNARGFTATPAS